jgi:hypothetical protein
VIIEVRDPGERTHARNTNYSYARPSGDCCGPVVGLSSLIKVHRIAANIAKLPELFESSRCWWLRPWLHNQRKSRSTANQGTRTATARPAMMGALKMFEFMLNAWLSFSSQKLPLVTSGLNTVARQQPEPHTHIDVAGHSQAFAFGGLL